MMQREQAVKQLMTGRSEGLKFAQVWIGPRQSSGGYELCHEVDRNRARSEMRKVGLVDLRGLAQATARGAFRPLKSAPNLVEGWYLQVSDDAKLAEALDHLYPGALADWLACQNEPAPVTSYRDFTGRQTGMYRITTHLSDKSAGTMIRACCHRRFCLKRRLWSVEGLGVDDESSKSLIPCLEPCAILLEFARRIARWEQEESMAQILAGATERELQAQLAEGKDVSGSPDEREADFGRADNPRVLQWKLENLRLEKGDG